MTTYSKPIFARGSGIGTRLFPWARCVLFSKENNIKMLRPNWVQPRIGPLFRGGIDLKSYHRQILLYGLFNSPENSPALISDLWARANYNTVEEDEFISQILENKYLLENKNFLIRFGGDGGRFSQLNGHDVFIKNELYSITNNKWKNFINSFSEVPIGINIRMGNDFKTPEKTSDHFAVEATKTPVQWFVESLNSVRKMIGYSASAYVVSDGTEDDLKELLSLPNTTFIRPGCAISDLLILSKANLLIRSGGSSFSAWASFLGQMPTISHPGQSMKEFNMINKNNYYTGEFMPNIYNSELYADIKKIFKI